MKNKRKLIHRIGALLCALVVAVSTFGNVGEYYASDVPSISLESLPSFTPQIFDYDDSIIVFFDGSDYRAIVYSGNLIIYDSYLYNTFYHFYVDLYTLDLDTGVWVRDGAYWKSKKCEKFVSVKQVLYSTYDLYNYNGERVFVGERKNQLNTYLDGYTLYDSEFGNGCYPIDELYGEAFYGDLPFEYINMYGGFYALFESTSSNELLLCVSSGPLSFGLSDSMHIGNGGLRYDFIYLKSSDNGATWNCYSSNSSRSSVDIADWSASGGCEWYYKLVSCNHYIENRNSYGINVDNKTFYYFGEPFALQVSFVYNSSLGYLQNIRHDVVFDEVPLGERVGEKYTERWYFDDTSTTGIDLTSGDYMIRYYLERWIVEGYEEDDVVDKGQRYVLGDFIATNGYIQLYSEDVESTLAGQGYEEPSFFDLWFNKFITTHYYFQIVNAKTGEVGGLVHIYLTDDNGKFGVELLGETIDLDGNIDNSGYSGFIDEGKITTDDTDAGFTELEQNNDVTIEEWFDDFRDDSVENFDGLDGAETFDTVVQGYVSQVSNVSKAVGVVLFQYPSWLLGSLGVGVACLFVGILMKKG